MLHNNDLLLLLYNDPYYYCIMTTTYYYCIMTTYYYNQSYGDNDVHHNNPQVKWKLKCKARRLKRKEVGLQGIKAAIKSKQSTIKKEKDIKKPNTEQVFKITSSLKNERTQRLKRVRETDTTEGKNRKQPKIITKTGKV